MLKTHKAGSHIVQINFKDQDCFRYCLALNVRLNAKGELLVRTPAQRSAILDVSQVNESMKHH